MDTFLLKNRRVLMIALSGIFWGSFYLVWGVWEWNDAELFSKSWKFDLYGHMLAGVVAGPNMLFLVRTYAIETISGKRLLIAGYTTQMMIALFWVMVLAVLWETGEAVHDILNNGKESIRAQSATLDTTLDIIAMVLSAIPTIILYIKGIKRIARVYPDEGLREALVCDEAYDTAYAEIYRAHNKVVRRALRTRWKTRWKKRMHLKKKEHTVY